MRAASQVLVAEEVDMNGITERQTLSGGPRATEMPIVISSSQTQAGASLSPQIPRPTSNLDIAELLQHVPESTMSTEDPESWERRRQGVTASIQHLATKGAIVLFSACEFADVILHAEIWSIRKA